eukprot:scaffold308858_cov33-Tisochrysis_lutea.AAC.3
MDYPYNWCATDASGTTGLLPILGLSAGFVHSWYRSTMTWAVLPQRSRRHFFSAVLVMIEGRHPTDLAARAMSG